MEYKIIDVYYVNDYTNKYNKKEYHLNEKNDPEFKLIYYLVQLDKETVENIFYVNKLFKDFLSFLAESVKTKTQFKNINKLYSLKAKTVYGTEKDIENTTILELLLVHIYPYPLVSNDKFKDFMKILYYLLYFGARYAYENGTFLPMMMFLKNLNGLAGVNTMKIYNEITSLNFENEIKLPGLKKTIKEVLNCAYRFDEYSSRMFSQKIHGMDIGLDDTLLNVSIKNNYYDNTYNLFRINKYVDFNKNNPFYDAIHHYQKNGFEADKYIRLFYQQNLKINVNVYDPLNKRLTNYMLLLELYDKGDDYDDIEFLKNVIIKYSINVGWNLHTRQGMPILLFYLSNKYSNVSNYLNSSDKLGYKLIANTQYPDKKIYSIHLSFYNSVQMFKRLLKWGGGIKLLKQTDKNEFSALLFLLNLNLEKTENKEFNELIQCFHDSIKKNTKLVLKQFKSLIKHNVFEDEIKINGIIIDIPRIFDQLLLFKIFDLKYIINLLYNINDDTNFNFLKSIIAYIDVDKIIIKPEAITFRSVLYKLLEDSDTERNRFLNNMNIHCLQSKSLTIAKLHELWNIITNYDDYEVFLDNYQSQQIQIKNVLSKSLEFVDMFMLMNDLSDLDINKIQPEYFYTYELPLPYDIIDEWESYKDVNWETNKKKKIYEDLKTLIKEENIHILNNNHELLTEKEYKKLNDDEKDEYRHHLSKQFTERLYGEDGFDIN